jgi:hypothetical protein
MLTISEQLSVVISKSRKQKNPFAYFYYQQFLGKDMIAFASWEQFRGSWAHSMFMQKYAHEIQSMIDRDNKRFPGTWKQY